MSTQSGSTAQYYEFTVCTRLREQKWSIVVLGPNGFVSNHDTKYSSEAEAQQVAVTLAQRILHQEKHDSRPLLEAVDWQPS